MIEIDNELPSTMIGTCQFIGTLDKLKDVAGNPGDIAFCHDKLHICTGGRWEELGSVPECNIPEKKSSVLEKIFTQCRNCGAPTDVDGVCRYCGTVNRRKEMTLFSKIVVLIAMIWLHIIDDYYLQGILAKLKQKSWWKDHAPNELYRYDYKIALFEHAFSWTCAIMIPATVCMLTGFIQADLLKYVSLFVVNVVLHIYIDNEKANRYSISLVIDQSMHFIQVICTWAMVFIDV